MCRYTIITRRPLLAAPVTTRRPYSASPLTTRARPAALSVVTRLPWAALPLATLARPAALRIVTLATQLRLITQTGAYLVTQDGRRLVVGVCYA
jgi:hypothetical protein